MQGRGGRVRPGEAPSGHFSIGGFVGLLEEAAGTVAEGAIEAGTVIAEGTGAVVGCATGCTIALVVGAIVTIVIAGVAVAAVVNADGTYTVTGSIDPQTGLPLGGTQPAAQPAPSTPTSAAASTPPTGQRVQPAPPSRYLLSTTSKTTTHTRTTSSTWWDDTYLYQRTDRWTTTSTVRTQYYSDGSWTQSGPQVSVIHTWWLVKQLLIDLSDPYNAPKVTDTGSPDPHLDQQARPDGTCGKGGDPQSCLSQDRTGRIPADADATPRTAADGAGDGGSDTPPTPSCMPDPPGDDPAQSDWVDPDTINYSQRTVGPKTLKYAEEMLNGQWDWNRSDASLRVIERNGQLVTYDNRRLHAAQTVRAQNPDYKVKVERVDPAAPNPEKSSGMSWSDSFELRMKKKQNWDENGCRVPWEGLSEKPRIE